MKRGFTLIEMLAIITVLGLVLVVAFPSINNSLKQMKESTTLSSLNNIKLSTETYIEINREYFPTLNTIGGVATIKVSDLYDANLIKGEQNGVNLDDVITVEVNFDNTFKYYFNGKEI